MTTFRNDIHLGRRVPTTPVDESKCMFVSLTSLGVATDKYGRQWKLTPYTGVEAVVYRGSSTGVPTSVDTTNGVNVSTLPSDVSITTTFEEQKDCHWLAVPNSAKLNVTKVVDAMNIPITTAIEQKTIGDYTVYYLYSSLAYIQNTTTFTINSAV